MPGALNRTNEAANYHLSYDTYNTEVINEHIYPKKLYLFGTPQDPDIFHDDTKELDVCFSGTIYEARKPYFEKLKALRTDSSLKLYLHEGQRVQNISADSYAENMRKSRINIDLPFSPNGTVTIKGRVYEALACNSLLLEYKNLEIEKMFKDGEHYVSFTSPEDMLDKISYFLKNTEEAEGIAKNGYNYYNTNYSPKVFWKRVVETDS
jgi:spore maturation protein CgeB